MTDEEYQKLAIRTCVPMRGLKIDPAGVDVLHAALGLAGEAGEIVDNVKKFLIYDLPFDEINFQEELGDALWHIAMICERMGWSMEKIKEANIKKLQVRFPEEAFTQERVVYRDLPEERVSLESNIQVSDGCPCHGEEPEEEEAHIFYSISLERAPGEYTLLDGPTLDLDRLMKFEPTQSQLFEGLVYILEHPLRKDAVPRYIWSAERQWSMVGKR